MTFTRALGTNNYGPCKFIVDGSSVANGTHSTIATALTSASSGDTIFIRPGTYTENLTLKAGVNLTAFECDAQTPNVTIVGNCTATFAGTCSISGIRLQTNNAAFLTVSGSSSTIVNLFACFLNVVNSTGISFTSSGGSTQINCEYCIGNITTNTITYYVSTSTGGISFYYCNLSNTGLTTTASSNSAGSAYFGYCAVYIPVTTTGTGAITGDYTQFNCGPITSTAIVNNGTTTGSLAYCKLESGNATCITCGASAALIIRSSSISTSNATSISGAGTIGYTGITMPAGTAITITNQGPDLALMDACTVATPGAYPYTTISQDYLILVDTASARTITPLASPTKGQMHVIKDNVGSAATNNITVTPSGKNIDGSASYVINSNYGSITIIYNGTQWNVV